MHETENTRGIRCRWGIEFGHCILERTPCSLQREHIVLSRENALSLALERRHLPSTYRRTKWHWAWPSPPTPSETSLPASHAPGALRLASSEPAAERVLARRQFSHVYVYVRYIYIYIYTHTHTHIYTYIPSHIHTHTHTHTHTHILLCKVVVDKKRTHSI